VPNENDETREIVNFGGNLRFTPRRYCVPHSEEEVLAILDRHAKERIRVVGSKHAWSEGIVSSDVIVDLRHFNSVELTERVLGEVWATVGGGCQIKHLLDEVHARSQFTLPALGLITEQTIAGAISTGTHGSGKHSLSHYMEEIRTAAYDPQTGRACIYAWKEGDDLRAARCSLGCMGIILSVRIRCVPKYLIADRVERCQGIDEVLSGEAEYPIQQFYLVPNLWGWFVQRRRTSPDLRRSWFAGIYRAYWFLGIDIGLHLIMKLLVGVLRSRGLVRFFDRRCLSPLIVRNVTIVDHSDRTLIMEHELFKHFEIEIFVPARHVRRTAAFVQDILRAFDSVDAEISAETADSIRGIGMEETLANLRGTFTHHYPVTFRRVLPDETLISMTALADEPYYAISFITYAEPRDAFRAMGTFLSQSMVRLFGARPHWGKFCPLSAAEAAELYPRLEDFRTICRRVDPEGVFQNEWVRRVLGFADFFDLHQVKTRAD
jgi:hypothetical protein